MHDKILAVSLVLYRLVWFDWFVTVVHRSLSCKHNRVHVIDIDKSVSEHSKFVPQG